MSIQRAQLLHDQGRVEEAEAAFGELLAHDPNNDFLHCRIALCQLEQEGRKKEALDSIDRAIALEPDHDYYYAVRALILAQLHRAKESIATADRAIALNPEASFNFTAKASGYCEDMRWADAEVQCRQALALDADNSFAANLLANVLRLQGKDVDSEIAVDQLLADDPEDALAHFNAGWSALQHEDHQKAEVHFREALRLDPGFDPAREGLLESFKARSFFYRIYLKYCFFMARFTGGKQWALIIGIYVVYQIVRQALKKVSPMAAYAFIAIYLAFVLWVWLAPGVGNALVLMDRSARHALRRSDKWQGIAVGFGLLTGIAGIVGGLISGYLPATLGGAFLLGSTIPASAAIGNPSSKGRLVFGSILGFIYLAGSAVTVLEILRHPADDIHRVTFFISITCLVATVTCTWIGNMRTLREDDSG